MAGLVDLTGGLELVFVLLVFGAALETGAGFEVVAAGAEPLTLGGRLLLSRH